MENKSKKDSKEKKETLLREVNKGISKNPTSSGPRRAKITGGSSSTGPRKPSK